MEIPNYLKDKLLRPSGGFSKADLEILGVPWPPPKGWKTEVMKRLQLEAEYRSKKQNAKAGRRRAAMSDVEETAKRLERLAERRRGVGFHDHEIADWLEEAAALLRQQAAELSEARAEVTALQQRLEEATLRVDVKDDGVWLIAAPKEGPQGCINLGPMVMRLKSGIAKKAASRAILEARAALQGDADE